MRYLTAAEARDLGVLLEVNRRGLHPRGLALETAVATEGDTVYTLVLTKTGVDRLARLASEALAAGLLAEDEYVGLHKRIDETLQMADAAILRVQDHRDDPEGVYYADLDAGDCAKADRFDTLLAEKAPSRHAALGYVEQPLPDQVAP